MEYQKESLIWKIGKWIVGVITTSGVIVGIIWVGLQYGDKQYQLGYNQGHGDIRVLNELIDHKDEEITVLNHKIELSEKTIDSVKQENIRLIEILESKVVMSDTIIYLNDGIGLLDGHIVVFCTGVWVDSTTGMCKASLIGQIFEQNLVTKSVPIDGWLGEQTEFEYQGKEYLLVILGMGKYNGTPGVKIAVYKNY